MPHNLATDKAVGLGTVGRCQLWAPPVRVVMYSNTKMALLALICRHLMRKAELFSIVLPIWAGAEPPGMLTERARVASGSYEVHVLGSSRKPCIWVSANDRRSEKYAW